MNDRAQRILAAASAHIPPGPLVVALSGGPDSALAAWVSTVIDPDRTVTAVFVHHGWPGSPTMADAATAVARTLDLPLTIVPVDVTTNEGDARTLRLDALDEAAAAADALVVTGHHGGDQAETVLLHLVRGAGASGLAGIPHRRGRFVRPLLDIDAEEVRRAAVELGLPFADDPANDDHRHLRNLIRHDVLPNLESVHPAAGRSLVRTARLLSADDAALEALAAKVPIRFGAGEALVPWGSVVTLDPAVASRVVRRALRRLHPPYAGDAADVDAVMAVRRGKVSQLTGGLCAERDGGFVAIYDPGALPPPPSPVRLPVPGSVAAGRITVTARRGPPLTAPDAASPVRSPMSQGAVAWIDAALAGDLTVRSAAAGERIDIGGGSKPARDAMAEAGIAPRLRPGWPVVAAHGKIAWLTGARVAAWASVPPSADGLRLAMERR